MVLDYASRSAASAEPLAGPIKRSDDQGSDDMYSLNHYRLHIETLIDMSDSCPIDYVANADGAQFTVGDPDESFEFMVSPGAMDNLIKTMTEAREKVRRAQEQGAA